MHRCLFLVEGPFDVQRLSLLKQIFDENKLVIFPVRGDKLIDKNYSKDFEKEIRNLLNREQGYRISDFDSIAQVCDLDGCFVTESSIRLNPSIHKIRYERDFIETNNPKLKIKLKKIKADNINSILKDGSIELYYNSTNIDDVFDLNQNPTNEEKKMLALKMYNKYQYNLEDFVRLIFSLDNLKCDSFLQSWDLVKQNLNSLKPSTNLKFFIIKHLDDVKDMYKPVIVSFIK